MSYRIILHVYIVLYQFICYTYMHISISDRPLFYHGADDLAARTLEDISSEIQVYYYHD